MLLTSSEEYKDRLRAALKDADAPAFLQLLEEGLNTERISSVDLDDVLQEAVHAKNNHLAIALIEAGARGTWHLVVLALRDSSMRQVALLLLDQITIVSQDRM
jgi:hypothetical protein